MSRISRDQWAMELAKITSLRSTCSRRRVGCVLLNGRGHVIATGYNGVAAGLPHCNEVKQIPVYHTDPRVLDLGEVWQFGEVRTTKFNKEFLDGEGNEQCVGFEYSHPHACTGADSPSGTNLDACQAIHAEQNALLQCRDVYEIETAYVTASPCVTCTKLLLNTACKRIVYMHEYPHAAACEIWQKTGRIWEKYGFDEKTTSIVAQGLNET